MTIKKLQKLLSAIDPNNHVLSMVFFSYSTMLEGHVERLNQALQSRPPVELRLAGITAKSIIEERVKCLFKVFVVSKHLSKENKNHKGQYRSGSIQEKIINIGCSGRKTAYDIK